MHLHKYLNKLRTTTGQRLYTEVTCIKPAEYTEAYPSGPGIYQAHFHDGLTLVGRTGDFKWTYHHMCTRGFAPWHIDFFHTLDFYTARVLHERAQVVIDNWNAGGGYSDEGYKSSGDFS